MEGKAAGIEKYTLLSIHSHGVETVEHYVAIEEPLQVIVNGRPVAVLMRTPGQEKELAVGYCVSEGIIGSVDEIGVVHHCGSVTAGGDGGSFAGGEHRNQVTIMTIAGNRLGSDPRYSVLRLVRSGCGRTDPAELAETLPRLDSSLEVSAGTIMELTRSVIAAQTAYRQSGGIHAVAIFDAEGRLITIGEDIGRHNAMDKAIGYCLLRRMALHDKILYSTGRASYEMVTKAARVGVPVLISRSSPTTLAIELAREVRCTLIGYARGERMHVYAGAERIRV